MFDEIQDVLAARGADVTLRSVIQHQTDVAPYAFAGSAPGVMARLCARLTDPKLELSLQRPGLVPTEGGGAGMSAIEIREAGAEDRRAIERLLLDSWHSTIVVSKGRVHDATALPALLAHRGAALVGAATLHLAGPDCEIVSLDAVTRHEGIGGALLAAAARWAAVHGARRLWLVTTNDNLDAIRFYQRRGMRLVAVRPGAVDRARQLKPSIPEVGEYGIPLRDELEFELAVGSGESAAGAQAPPVS